MNWMSSAAQIEQARLDELNRKAEARAQARRCREAEQRAAVAEQRAKQAQQDADRKVAMLVLATAAMACMILGVCVMRASAWIGAGLLGAAALGDIGQHFPDTDPAYKGADSIALLQEVGRVLARAGWAAGNIDATLLCQAPKLAPHIPAMRENLAAALGISAEDVSVKATTEEKLGFTGSGEGIAAHSVCLLRRI